MTFRHILTVIAAVWAVALAAVWIWIHAATRDDEATDIADLWDYEDALEDDE